MPSISTWPETVALRSSERHRLAQLHAQHISGLVLDVQVAGELQRANALRAVHEDRNGREDNRGWKAGGSKTACLT